MTTTSPGHVRPEPITRLADVRAPHNVVAAVRDAEEARAAIATLERHGIDGSHIALLGSFPAGTGPSYREFGRVGKLFALGGGLGALAGGLVGALSGIGGAAAGIIWGLFGGLVGAFVMAVASMGMSRAWWQTFPAEHAGTLAVGVHTADAGEADRAERVLASVHPLSAHRF